MTMHAEPMPIELVGGPMDGMVLDVTPDTDVVRRPMPVVKRTAVYRREGNRFVFAGYLKDLE